MATIEVQVGDFAYQIDSIAANRALHVLRRLAGPVAGLLKDIDITKIDVNDIDKLRDVEVSFSGLGAALSAMPEKAFDEVVFDLLRRTKRVAAQGNIPVITAPGSFALADLDWSEILVLVYYSIRHNLSNFRKLRSLGGKTGANESVAAPSPVVES